MKRGLTDSDIILWYAKKDLARLEAWWECNVPLDQATPQGWKPVIEGKELECRVFDAMTWCRYALNTEGDYGNKWDRLLIIRELLIELYLPNGNPLQPLSPSEAATRASKVLHAKRRQSPNRSLTGCEKVLQYVYRRLDKHPNWPRNAWARHLEKVQNETKQFGIKGFRDCLKNVDLTHEGIRKALREDVPLE